MIKIEGNTYPVRERLKALGCRWSPSSKCWIAPTEAIATRAREIVPQGEPRPARRGSRTCKDCGARINYGVYCGKCEFR